MQLAETLGWYTNGLDHVQDQIFISYAQGGRSNIADRKRRGNGSKAENELYIFKNIEIKK